MPKHPHISDPVELVIAEALHARSIDFIHESDGFGQQIDFYLPDYGVAIECKRFHTPRSLKQLSEHPEIILIQGIKAAKAFSALLEP